MTESQTTICVGDHFHRDGYVWEVFEVCGDLIRMRRAGKIIECEQRIDGWAPPYFTTQAATPFSFEKK